MFDIYVYIEYFSENIGKEKNRKFSSLFLKNERLI